ncbi:MAG: DUF433 domain-containing protein [Janthinobacterium lividum]
MPETLEQITSEQTASRPLPDDYWDGEIVTQEDPRFGTVSANMQRVSGTPCFVGTRVPIRNLWDYLEEGPSMEEFLDSFPGVSIEQAKAALRLACKLLLDGLPPDTCHP